MNETFGRELKTRELDLSDFDILDGGVMFSDKSGKMYRPTLSQLNAAGFRRITGARNILTGEYYDV